MIFFMFPTILFGQNKCIGDTITLWVDSNASWSYKWIVEPPVVLIGQSSPSIRIDSLQGNIEVYVEVSNNYGCLSEAYLYLSVDDCGWTIYFANALVPSGTNTTWFPKYDNVVIRELTIWDRWGNVQWTWNGTDEFYGINNKGNELDGIFSFLCVYSPQGKKVEYRAIGSVTVVR